MRNFGFIGITYSTFIALALFCAGCQVNTDNPTANFTANNTEGLAPLQVVFQDLSTPGASSITAWAWNFGDGVQDTTQNPTHTYSNPGVFTVTLTVTTDIGSDTQKRINYITVTSEEGEGTEGETNEGENEWEGEDLGLPFDPSGDYDELDYTWDGEEVAYITFNGNAIVEDTDGASAVGSILTISSSGTYSISGSLSNGRIIVDVDSSDNGVVRLIFNGMSVTCLYGAPFYVANAKRTAILLPDGSRNVLTDATTYTYFDNVTESEPNAALFCDDYLTIGAPTGSSGTGQLTVNGNYNDGITGKDGVILDGGTITVDALDDAIRGKDYLVVIDGDINVTTALGDGLKSDNADDVTTGFITIKGGSMEILSGGDGIQAETYALVYNGTLSIQSGGGAGTSFNAIYDSKKGIKGTTGVIILNGDLFLNAADDAVHSNDSIDIYGGAFEIYSGDDGIHADASVEILDGDIGIWQSYEGIESTIITIRGGNIHVESTDDGLNCADGSGGMDPIGPPQTSSGDFYLNIYGGYLAVYAQGDGLDSNGDITMTSGTVVIHGPTGRDNGTLDCGDVGASIIVNGGLLVGAGSSGMPESPSSTSAQKYKLLIFTQKSADTFCHIESADGTEVMTFQPAKRYESIIVSSPNLVAGKTYNVYFGGTYTGGTNTDGLYSGGAYSGGTQNTALRFSL